MAHVEVGEGEVVGGVEGKGGGTPQVSREPGTMPGRHGRSLDPSWGGLGAGRMALWGSSRQSSSQARVTSV